MAAIPKMDSCILTSSTLINLLISGRDEKLIGPHNTIVFSRDGATVNFKNENKEIARFVLISGTVITVIFVLASCLI